MNIELLEESVPGASGYLRLSFEPLYSLTAYVLDKTAVENAVTVFESWVNPPRKGVCVLVEPPEEAVSEYNIYVGHGGVVKSEKSPAEKEYKKEYTLLNTMQNHASRPPSGVEKWRKAILICNWDNDIQSEQKGKYHREKELIDQVMYDEVFHLSKILSEKLQQYKRVNFEVHGEHKETSFMPNPDSLRYQYYIGVTIELLRMMIEQGVI